MSYTPPVGSIAASWVGRSAAPRHVAHIKASWLATSARDVYQPQGIAPPIDAVPAPGVRLGQQWVFPGGAVSSAFGAQYALNDRTANYRPPQFAVHGSWVGAAPYAPSLGSLRVSWDLRRVEVLPGGFAATAFGTAAVIQSQYIAPAGWSESVFGAPIYALHDYEYAPPKWVLNASWVGKDLYYPPVHVLPAAWTLPAESKIVSLTGWDGMAFGPPTVALQFRYIAPVGVSTLEAGSPTVANGARIISPAGIAAPVVPSPSVGLKYRYLYAAGVNALSFGTPSLVNRNKFVTVSGFAAASYGAPSLELLLRKLAPNGFSAALFGSAYLAGGVRTIDLGGRSLIATLYGTAFVAYAERLISPAGFFTAIHGKPTVGFNRGVEPAGSDMAQFGATDVRDNTQRVYVGSFNASAVGEPFVAPHTRKVEQLTSPYDGGFGTHWARNTSRYIEPYTDTPDVWGPYFSTFTYVENRDRAVTTFGVRATLFGLTLVENGARAAALQGFEAAEVGKPDVSHRVRSVQPGGVDALSVGNWAVVVNGARGVAPAGFDGAAHSRFTELRNTTRELTYAGGEDLSAFGLAYADYRIRTVAQLQSIDAPYVPTPSVVHKQRFLQAQGLEGGRMGVPFIEERFTKIAPRWVYVDMFGAADLRNRNRSIGIYGYDLTEWGRPAFALKRAYVSPPSFGGEAIGDHRIGDTRHESKPVGFSAFRASTAHKVQLLQPELPVPQTIDQNGGGGGFFGEFGQPHVYANTLYPPSITDFYFGVAKVVSNGIMPIGIFLKYEEQWGTPSLNPPQVISNAGNINQFSSSPQRLDHHTIWCTFDVPQQAVTNHGGHRWESVGGNERPAFGRAEVSLAHRSISPQGRSFLQVPAPTVDLWTRYIRPNGLLSFRYGFPSIPVGSPVVQYGYDQASHGMPTVTHYIDPMAPRTVVPSGSALTLYGRAQVDLFHREIKVNGIQPPGIPAVPYVGPQRRLVSTGALHDDYGLPWISYRIRHVTTKGADTAVLDYTVGRFADRMKVYRHAPSQVIQASGDDMAAVGYGNVSNTARTIRPLNCCHQDRMGRPVVQAA